MFGHIEKSKLARGPQWPVAVLMMSVALLAGCYSESHAEPAASSSSQQAPSLVAPEPSATPDVSPTPHVENWPTPRPSATATPRPTATPTPRPTATPTPRPTATPTPTPPVSSAEYPPLWEAARPGTGVWTQHVYDVVNRECSELMAGTADIAEFCPRYFDLSVTRKLNFWAVLTSAIVKYESNFNPTSRFREPGMGTDGVTGQPVYSEGLMQLSYQDTQWYRFCDEFDWERDRQLSPTDPRKTILDPFKNLRCGLLILNNQVRRYDKIAIGSGAYWAVIKTNSRYNKLSQIKAITRAIPFCN